MRTPCTFLAVLLIAVAARSQLPAGHLVVATRTPALPPATLLVDVDPATGAMANLGRFFLDSLPPLAVAVDPVSRDVLVALDLGGTSRIVRLGLMRGLLIGMQHVLADVPGTCTQLVFAKNGDVYAAIDGAGGGLVEIPRYGGTGAQVLAAPRLTAMADFGFLSPVLVLAQSGVAGPPVVDPRVGFYDIGSGQWTFGPFRLTGFVPRGITGIVDLPTGAPRQVLSHTDGTFSVYLTGSTTSPMPVPTMPALPPGGAVAMKAVGGASFDPIVLGGATHPFLETFTVFLGPTPAPLQRVAGPLPGDPVDFAVVPDDSATLLPFGTPCGAAQPMHIGVAPGSGLPRLGNTGFAIGLSNGTANAPALLAMGLSDLLAPGMVPLPFTLPSGCELNVAPTAVSIRITDAMGQAQVGIAVPNDPGLVGFQLFTQWLQAPAQPFATSQPAVVRVGQ